MEAALLDDSAAAKALRTGRIALVVVPRSASNVEYRFDDTRPDAAARRVVDDVLQRGGRADPILGERDQIRERGSRYIDFVVPGLLGMNLLGSGIWGIGFSVVDARRKRLLKRLVATPMPKAAYLASFIIPAGAAGVGGGPFLINARLRRAHAGSPTFPRLVSPDRFAFGGLGLQPHAPGRSKARPG